MTAQMPSGEPTPAAWDAVADGFDEFVTPVNSRHGAAALSRIDIGPGTRLLDVAAGSGALSIPAARRGADVTATDISPRMIERLRARASAAGVPNLQARVMDGMRLEYDDDTFDVAVSQHGVSTFVDLRGGLAELVRVTKPGGRVLVGAFGALSRAEFFGFLVGAVRAAIPGFVPPPADPPPLPFQLADVAVFRDRLVEAGLSGVTIDTTEWDTPYESATHFLAAVSSSHPIAATMVAQLAPSQRAQVTQVLDGMLRERSGGAPGAVLHAEVHIGAGTVPGWRS